MRWNLVARSFVILLVASLCLSGCKKQENRDAATSVETASAAPQPKPEIIHHPDLTYAQIDANTTLELDLVCPGTGAGPFPTVICIHGGGWMKGSRKSNLPLMEELARQGYAAASVSYRMAPKQRFPGPAEDVKRAVRWLRAHAVEYQIDKERIAAFGYSSGGLLACMLGTTSSQDNSRGAAEEESSAVQAVVAFYPMTDLARLHTDCKQGRLRGFNNAIMQLVIEGFLGGSPDKQANHAEASPIHHVHKSAAPTLLIHGTADGLVPSDQSEVLAKKLKDAGAQVQLLTILDAPHDFQGADEKLANAAALEFLHSRFRPTTSQAGSLVALHKE